MSASFDEKKIISDLSKKLKGKSAKLSEYFKGNPDRQKVYSSSIGNLNLLVKRLSRGERIVSKTKKFVKDDKRARMVRAGASLLASGGTEPIPGKNEIGAIRAVDEYKIVEEQFVWHEVVMSRAELLVD